MSSDPTQRPTTIGGCATLACLWEATAAKPGNVHRGADFADMSYVDFLVSAAVIGPVFDSSAELGLGGTVLEAVRATRGAVDVNTNLGTLLLLAPLALAEGDAEEATRIVQSATREDTSKFYAAIREAMPGGLGKVDEGDVSAEPQHSLLEAMQLAADRDLVARQFTNQFAEVTEAANQIADQVEHGSSLNDAIIRAQLLLVSRHGDSLVERKLGADVSRDLAARAASVLALANRDPQTYHAALADLDFWLRADGHRRNPGTTADLVAAALFVLLAGDRLSWPVKFYS
jgi:triphosphoribosyl-dephospho-CoA synthase